MNGVDSTATSMAGSRPTVEGRVGIIPGASRGIGAATARAFVAAGAFALGAVLIAVWAIWHGGVPEFSDL